jgi:hypothetical protein
MAGDVLQLIHRRVIAAALRTWLPLLVLSVAEGHAWGASVRVPFLLDVEMHVRLLLALPLLIVAELVVHQRMRLVVRQFLDRGLIADAVRPQFDAAIASAIRLRNSIAAEVLLIALVQCRLRAERPSAASLCHTLLSEIQWAQPKDGR